MSNTILQKARDYEEEQRCHFCGRAPCLPLDPLCRLDE